MAKTYYYGEEKITVACCVVYEKKHWPTERFMVFVNSSPLLRKDGGARTFKTKDAALNAGKSALGVK